MADRRELEKQLGIGAFKQRMPRPECALPGRDAPVPTVISAHRVHGRPLRDRFDGFARVQFGMGCFWGAERSFWSIPGVHTTAVGYAGGYTPHPTYAEVCSGETGHAEVVLVVYDAAQVGFDALLGTFWAGHDPTQGMRQGPDLGTQYRSAIFCDTQAQYDAALASRKAHESRLREAGRGPITTEIAWPAPAFYYAEAQHQQYLALDPGGGCSPGGVGAPCPVAGVD